MAGAAEMVISATSSDISGDWLMQDIAPSTWDVTFTPKGMVGTGLFTLVVTGSSAVYRQPIVVEVR